MRYEIRVLPAAQRDLKRIRGRDLTRIEAAIDSLADDPRPAGSTKLLGEQNLWRIRVGDYRVLYENHERLLLVLVVHVGHRKDIYRKRS